jgi:ATP-dependent DNA helicase RecG
VSPDLKTDDDFVRELLDLPEGLRFDCKRVGPKNDRKLETIVAFANTEGGLLALGVEDPKKAKGRERLHGIDENPESIDELKRLLIHRVTPPLRAPDTDEPKFFELKCALRDGRLGKLTLVTVAKSAAVHSIVDGGTPGRFEKSNRWLSAEEITRLSLQRGKISAVDEPVPVPFDLLDTATWRSYAESRRLTRVLPEALRHTNLAREDASGIVRPTRAAVLLFAEEPNGLLNSKCTVRVFHYRGDRVEHTASTNLVRPPRTAGGPLIEQIRRATELTIDALASGVQVGPLGFEIVQEYPVRVIREAITNAIVHRDYGISADTHVRIFDNRIEVESPGLFPGRVTAANILTAGSRPRNRSIVDHLREFPSPPNLDAGEGIRMMFDVMDRAKLYLPIFFTQPDIPRDAVEVVLLNQARPSTWDQVQHFLRDHKTIGNAEVRRILRTDNPVKASKLLKSWLDAGLLVAANPEVGARLRRYRLPGVLPEENLFSFAAGKQVAGKDKS